MRLILALLITVIGIGGFISTPIIGSEKPPMELNINDIQIILGRRNSVSEERIEIFGTGKVVVSNHGMLRVGHPDTTFALDQLKVMKIVEILYRIRFFDYPDSCLTVPLVSCNDDKMIIEYVPYCYDCNEYTVSCKLGDYSKTVLSTIYSDSERYESVSGKGFEKFKVGNTIPAELFTYIEWIKEIVFESVD